MFHVSRFPALASDGDRLAAAPARSQEKDARDELRQAQAKVPAVRLEHEMIVADRPDAQLILRTLKERACDLIVMGTRVRTGRKNRVFSSTTEDVVRKARCPVIVVTAPAREADDSANPSAYKPASRVKP
jgi:nucleotide-binding universal stress UspA family protein